MLRVIQELRPTWVLGENVPGIVNLALDTVLADLENIGYSGQAFVIPACGVDAPHKRERVAIVAYSLNGGSSVRWNGELQDSAEDGREGSDNRGRTAATLTGERRQDQPRTFGMADGLRGAVYETYSDADGNGLSGRLPEPVLETGFTEYSSREREPEARVRRSAEKPCGSHSPWEAWPPEPGVGRVADGISNRVDRIKCLGNAVVPQQFYIFFKLIHDIEERGENHENRRSGFTVHGAAREHRPAAGEP